MSEPRETDAPVRAELPLYRAVYRDRRGRLLPPCWTKFSRLPRWLLLEFQRIGERSYVMLMAIVYSNYRATEGHKRGEERVTGATRIAQEFGFERSHVSRALAKAHREGWLNDDGTYGPRVRIPDGDGQWFKVMHHDVRALRAPKAIVVAQVRNLPKLNAQRTADGVVMSARYLGSLVCASAESARRWIADLDAAGYIERKVRNGYAAAVKAGSAVAEAALQATRKAAKRLAQAVKPAPQLAAAGPDLVALAGDETAALAEQVLAQLAGASG